MVESTLESKMTQALQLWYNKTGNESLTEAWDIMQVELKCCGIADPSDWQSSWFAQHQSISTTQNMFPGNASYTSIATTVVPTPSIAGTSLTTLSQNNNSTCCGVAPSTQPPISPNSGSVSCPVPLSCCVLSNTDYKQPQPKNVSLCYQAANNSSQTNRNLYLNISGCKDSLESWIKGHVTILAGIAIGLAFLQVGGVIVACYLSKRLRCPEVV